MKNWFFFLLLGFLSCSVFAKITDGGPIKIIIIEMDNHASCTKASPNPSDGVVVFTALETSNLIQSIVVKDLDGNVVLTKNCTANSCEIDASGLSTGDYTVDITANQCTERKRMVVE